MEMLKIRLRFTPSYHPRGNYTERVNRFIGESLRTLVSMDGAKQSDWWKLTKFVEFAYRRMYIPGTNLTPFMVARGRQPTVPSELERLQTGGALPSMSSLDAHTQELQKHLQLATQLLTAAREKQLAVSREKFNQSQVETIFIPGEHVRLWKRVPIRRHEGSGEIASKLKLFNKEYLVVKREGTRYRIRDVITGKETDAHVSQIARMRSHEDEREEEAAPIAEVQAGDTLPALELGHFCVIWNKSGPKSVLAVMEVLEISEDDQSFLGWYYISITGDVWNPELPLVERRLKPEWAEKRTQRRGKPPAGQESKWEEIYGEFSSSQVEILAPKFDLQSDGKVPEPVCRKVDTWLRRAMKSSPRAVLALSYPNEAEIKMQNRYKQRSMKLR